MTKPGRGVRARRQRGCRVRNPGRYVVERDLRVQVAQQHVPAVPVKDDPGARSAERGERGFRRDKFVPRAEEDQRRQPRRGGERRVHCVHQPLDGVDPGPLDDQRVAAERVQHPDVVGCLNVQPFGG